MLDKKILELLVCPVNRQPLRPAEEAILDRLNRAIAAGTVKNRAGRPVAEPLTEALVRQDGCLLYPLRDGIPVLLADEGIEVEREE
jgi:uncharacterized protein YbaR (Trm112 family)